MSATMPDFRTAVMTLVEASWEDESGTLRTAPARMEDKSAGGACIRIKTPIRVGSKLRIQWRFEQFSGIAKYCRSEGRDYVVGIQRDAANSPNPSRLLRARANVPPPEGMSSSPPVLTVKIESPTTRQESKPVESAPAPPAVESVPIVHGASPGTRDASSQGWSRNRQSQQTSGFAVSGLSMLLEFKPNGLQKQSKLVRKGNLCDINGSNWRPGTVVRTNSAKAATQAGTEKATARVKRRMLCRR